MTKIIFKIVSCRSEKQSTVSKSSSDAKYQALDETTWIEALPNNMTVNFDVFVRS
jgi:hypothetical protein